MDEFDEEFFYEDPIEEIAVQELPDRKLNASATTKNDFFNANSEYKQDPDIDKPPIVDSVKTKQKSSFFIARNSDSTVDEKNNSADVEEFSPEMLLQSKKSFYRKKFDLWIPSKHDFDTFASSNDLEEKEKVEMLPVDELLERVVVKQLRVHAFERSCSSFIFLTIFAIVLVLQRPQPNVFQHGSALRERVDYGVSLTHYAPLAAVRNTLSISPCLSF